MGESNAVTSEQVKCSVWICGLYTPDDADIRTRALWRIEDSLQNTLEELSLEIQQFLSIRDDTKLHGSSPSLLQAEVNAVATKKNVHGTRPCQAFDVEDRTGRKNAASSTRHNTVANSSVTGRGAARTSPRRRSEIRRSAELRITSSLLHPLERTSRRSTALTGRSTPMAPHFKCASTPDPTSLC
ncbi:unnamed protein product [Toxocara canis]|uniref:Uncharacterized protein n=1 Tax=Toxocara canis TaxID=6265 RepID=A0A183VD14_TOXCA|nr:unnamed protein product [Toxocara canis]